MLTTNSSMRTPFRYVQALCFLCGFVFSIVVDLFGCHLHALCILLGLYSRICGSHVRAAGGFAASCLLFVAVLPLPDCFWCAQIARLATVVADKSQIYTQKDEKRPFGVGMLIIGCDSTGPHLFETSPSGNFSEYYAQV